MIDPTRLVADLKRFVTRLEDDLRERSASEAPIDDYLRAEYAAARDAQRTAAALEAWREEMLTQGAVAWVLGTVFVRFLEDNALIEEPRLSGPGARLARAKDRHTAFFQQHPALSDRDYLLAVFAEMAELPGAGRLFARDHDLVWKLGISGDAATALLELWQRIDPATGALVHDFTEPQWDTRFLGDLYQDLSESARKRYALLQTPAFVEAFILDRTLTPAINEFGYRNVRLIDPTCGSGHFLLGAFGRLYELHARHEPGTNPRVLAQRVLDQVYGVDVNPYAAAIARFRLLLAALAASGIERLKDAPAFTLNVAAGDSLIHGPRFGATGAQLSLDPKDSVRHVLFTEDREALHRILSQRYHAVVGNPPYITVKDKALNQAYRDTYEACHRQYSLAVPFMQRFFELAIPRGDNGAAGFVGMITANSFMKREFGKKLIEDYIKSWDLTHVIDTSGAYIPGHGTPTVILFGRNQLPVSGTIRAVLGIRGEPSTPEDPALGLVWQAIVTQVDQPGSLSDFVSVADSFRETFHEHPWSIGGGGAAELKLFLDEQAERKLSDVCEEIGFLVITGEDNCLLLEPAVPRRHRFSSYLPLADGEVLRDWQCRPDLVVVWPYDERGERLDERDVGPLLSFLWPYRTSLKGRKAFGVPIEQKGLVWWELRELYTNRLRTPLSIAFAFVATHNHFVLDRGGKVFKQSAPVIKLPPGATEDDHLALLGLLNSSVACFWMKQVFFNKGSTVDERGARQRTLPFEDFWEHDGTKLQQFPLPEKRDLFLSKLIATAATTRAGLMDALISRTHVPKRDDIDASRSRNEVLVTEMIGLQEELDWQSYRAFGLVEEDLWMQSSAGPPIRLGERAFEIVMARQTAAGELETKWFERHGSTPITEIPRHWPEDYRALVQRRIDLIASNPNVRLIEQPEYKRRWNTEPWEAQQERAMRHWLLDRLEDARHWPAVELMSCARLADRVRQDGEFLQVAELYRGRADFDLTALVTELVESEAVPFLPVLRYKPSGLRKREIWERTWELQRREDALRDAAFSGSSGRTEIPVPPKYTSADFLPGPSWHLRGKLDVPKERFIVYPHAEREADRTPVIAWAGWDHRQQAQALASYFMQMKEQEGWSAERLTPLLAGIQELVPWLKQWHNDLDPLYGVGMGSYFDDFVQEEARLLGLTPAQVGAWTPPARSRRPRSGASAV